MTDTTQARQSEYKLKLVANERFIDTVRRIGLDPFKASANAVRRSTAHARAA